MLELKETEMWVQVYDIPRGFLSENILKNVGASIGKYVKSDTHNFEGAWKTYVRVSASYSFYEGGKTIEEKDEDKT